MLSKEQIQFFFEEGYLIIKNYIQDLNIDYNLIPKRNPYYLHAPRKFINDGYNKIEKKSKFIKSNIQFIKLFNNPKISKILNQLYPYQDIFSSGLHKSFTSKYNNTQNSKSKMHRDTYQSSKIKEINFNEDFKIVKSIIYFQDLKNYSDTIKVIPNSHKSKNNEIKENLEKIKLNNIEIEIVKNAKNLDIEAGDLILFDIRLIHSGHSSRFKDYNYVLSDKYENNKNDNIIEHLLPSNKKDRILIQNEYIINKKYLNNFIYRFNTEKKLYQELYKCSKLDVLKIKEIEKNTKIKMVENIYNN